MKIQVKKIDQNAVIPTRANESDAGYDIVAIDDGTVDKNGFIQYRTGLCICTEIGYHVEIFPRSSISKYDLILANSIGLVDNGYRGEILVRFKPVLSIKSTPMSIDPYIENNPLLRKYKKGDKIAQLVVRKTENAEFTIVEELSESDRGTGGFGSTGS